MNPTTWLASSETPSGANMRELCIQAMQLLTENMSVDELGAEIRRLTPLVRALMPVVEQEQTDEELRAAVRLKVAAEWNELGKLAYQASINKEVPSKKLATFVRGLYTGGNWPSPLPRLMVLELGMTTNKRIPHIQAIHMLAKSTGLTFYEFLSKGRREVGETLFPLFYWSYGYKTYGVRRLLYK